MAVEVDRTSPRTTATSATRSTIGVSTADIAGERDWFDLGVTISVEGRELPFAEVFAALASGESHMLLDGRRALLAARLRGCRRCGS